MKKISSYQLFSVVTIYEIGTTVVFGFSSETGRAAWIAVLISTSIGILINLVYLMLMHMNPGLSLVQWYTSELGTFIGGCIAWLYPLAFIYDGARGLADLDILVPSTLLPKTPILVIRLIFILVIIYALFSGLEAIARMSEIFLPIIVILFILEIILLFLSDSVNLQYIKPFLGKGWGTIWKSVFPLGITQTFGQSIEFAMIWPLVKDSSKIVKSTLSAIIFAGIFMAILDALAIVVFGENTFSNSVFPMYRLIRVINVGRFIENLEAVNVLYFLTTMFFKLVLHFYTSITAVQQLTYSKNKKTFIIPVAIIAFFISMGMSQSASEHLEVGIKIIPYNLWFPLHYILPVALLITICVKRKCMKLNLKRIN